MTLSVVIPAFNEQNWIGGVLESLATQADRDFDTVIVDNASTDRTAAIIADFIAAHPEMSIAVITESEKGTGAAADTGMRYAIAHGATHLARTDADCLPEPDWISSVRRAFGNGSQLIAGQMLPRPDEEIARPAAVFMLGLVEVAAWFGKLRPGNRGPQYLGPYMMTPGCNMAITAELYTRSGGFPRTRIEDVHEDRALVNAVRTVTTDYATHRDVRVRVSARRERAWGVIRTLGWYADHRYRPDIVDIR
ncbi:glycosyltransferase family A protein [Gordonia sp. CPCC 205515]|uniref:glycosyltransferase family 2 protein n=1 Tax=Gordonia sp. CPCC 205515 TaxID=3140791 RepID=UPI003AF3AD66